MRLRTKLLFAFLASPTFLFLETLRASSELKGVGRDVDNLGRYTQAEDLRGQVIVELLSAPDPDSLATDRLRGHDLVHAERALVLCRALEPRTQAADAVQAVARTEESLSEYLAAMHGLEAAVIASGTRATFLPEGRRARRAWDDLMAVRGLAGPRASPDALEPVAHEARNAVAEIVKRTEDHAGQLVATGLVLSVVLTLAAALLLSRLTALPIVRLSEAARAVSRGNLDATVPAGSSDELGDLSRAFNLMTGRLRDLYRGLNEEVRKRTDELRRREADLERERKLAAVGRLAAGVAHEVSNPLAVIAASAEGLRDRAREDPELSRLPGFQDFPGYLERIENEAYRLKKLVRSLLDFSRGGTGDGTEPPRRERFELGAVARDAVAFAALDPRARARPIDAAGTDGVSLETVGDPDAIKEALLNLLFNALDATARGGTVSVHARRAGSFALVEVRDTGEGIDRENLERLFEPFFTTKPPGQGTGLGLALAYRACERHGGRLVAASEGRGRGACFTLELPLAGGET
jgi:signal transduction histidine kinase